MKMPKALVKKVGHALSPAREVLSHHAPLPRLVLRAQVPSIMRGRFKREEHMYTDG